MARSRSERVPSSGGCGGSQCGAPASSRSRGMPAGAPWRNSTSPGRRISSPSTSVIQSRSRRMATTRMPVCTGQLEVGQRAVRHVATLAHAHPVRHLLGVGQVGHQRPGDAEAVGDDAGDVDGGVADALDGADDLQHRGHGVGVPGRAGGEHAHGAHVVHQVGQPLLEVVDLLGHVGVAEVEGGVGQVDHELGGVLRLREHGLEVSRSVVHQRCPSSVPSRSRPGRWPG